jgi:hypothetical protein
MIKIGGFSGPFFVLFCGSDPGVEPKRSVRLPGQALSAEWPDEIGWFGAKGRFSPLSML